MFFFSWQQKIIIFLQKTKSGSQCITKLNLFMNFQGKKNILGILDPANNYFACKTGKKEATKYFWKKKVFSWK